MKLSTAERGYGYSHQAMRRKLLPLAYGQPCPICGEAMLLGQALDLDHSTPLSLDSTQAHGDRITHQSCNRAQHRRAAAKWDRRSRDCTICGQTYLPKHRDQRCCSRPCGVELKQRNATVASHRSKRIVLSGNCAECGASFITYQPSQVTCSITCGEVHRHRRIRDRERKQHSVRKCLSCKQAVAPYEGRGAPRKFCVACRPPSL